MRVIRVENELKVSVVKILYGLILFTICTALIFLGVHSYLLFHILLEMFCAFTALAVALTAYNGYSITKKDYFFYISIISLFSGILLILHTLLFDTHMFPGLGSKNISIQLSMAFKTYGSLVFGISFLLHKYKYSIGRFVYISLAVTFGLILSILVFQIFPECINARQNPTLFKVVYDSVLLAINAIFFLFFIVKRRSFPKRVVHYIVVYLLLGVFSQMFSVFYKDVDDICNIFAHLMRFASFYVLFRMVLELGFKRPVKNLFSSLDKAYVTLEEKTGELININKKLEMETRKCKKAKRLLSKSEENYRMLFELNKFKINFFTDMSHEIRTPISVILCVIQIIEEGLKGNVDFLSDKKKTNRYIATLKQNSLKLLRTVNNLLDISKIDSGAYELKLQNCDIVDLVENVVSSVAEYTKNKNLTLKFNSDVEKKIIACDIEKIERVILNLLSNAIKFTAQGASINVSIHEEAGNIIISVKDTGIGIPENRIDTIFQRFKRVEDSFVKDYESTGIGLSLVKSLVEMHEGTVWVESKLGVGSTFYVKIPTIVLPKDVGGSNIDYCQYQQNQIEGVALELSDTV